MRILAVYNWYPLHPFSSETPRSLDQQMEYSQLSATFILIALLHSNSHECLGSARFPQSLLLCRYGFQHWIDCCLNYSSLTYTHYFHFSSLLPTIHISNFRYLKSAQPAFFRQAFQKTIPFTEQKFSNTHNHHQTFLRTHFLQNLTRFKRSLTSSLAFCFSFTYQFVSFFEARQVVLARAFVTTFACELHPHVIISVREP